MPTTSFARPATFSSSSTELQSLRNQIQGRGLVPGDDGYDAARQTWNATTFEQQPAIVVLPLIDSLLRIAGDRAAGIFLVEARHMGGALARQRETSMPFGFRSPWFISALAAAPIPDALQGGKRSIDALLQALKPMLTGERLINGIDAGSAGPHVTRAAYSPENYQKLVALKDTYDPGNVFRFNHNIAPSTT